jgi:bacterial/archaeal transporter family-2 protein
VAVQSRINAALAQQVGGGLVAAAISFGTGLLLTFAILLALPRVRRGFGRLRWALGRRWIRWWQLLGGMGGAWLVTTQGLVVTVVGVTIFTIAVVAGQVGGSLGVDRLGLSPAGALPVTVRRASAAVVALLAVVASGWAHAGEGGGSAAVVAVALAVSAGLGISVQQAINGRVSQVSGDALVAATVNFIVGTTALCLALSVCLASGLISLGVLPSQWWMYLGGPIGVTFIALAAWAVRHMGVLTFGLLSIAGQLVGSVALDVFAPAAQTRLAVGQILGLLLVVLAVWLAASGTRRSAARPTVQAPEQ